MFDSGILDTVIGLMFVFLLVSLLVTIVGEGLAAIRMSRAKILREGIMRMLGSKWGENLYAHPLIAGSGRLEAGIKDRKDGPSYIPSRSFANVVMRLVEDNSAGLAAVKASLHNVLDSAAATGASLETLKSELSTAAAKFRSSGAIGAAAAENLQRRLDAPPTANTRGWLTEVQTRVHELQGAGQPSYTALLDALTSVVNNGIKGEIGAQQLRIDFDNAISTLLTGPTTVVLREELTAMGHRLQGPYTVGDAIADFRWFTDGISATCLRHLLEEVPDAHTREILLTLFDDASHDIEKFKQNVEVWFNNGMDRVNGWYKRHTQAWSFGLAVIIAVALNVDAVAIFRHLQTDKGAREALVARAGAYMDAEKAAAQRTAANGLAAVAAQSGAQPDGNNVAPGGNNPKAGVTPAALTNKAPAAASGEPSAFDEFDKVNAKLQSLSLPIGWVSSEGAEEGDIKKGLVMFPGDKEKSPLPGHLLGWLITALAATLGAPFWFDMLNRIMSIRNTGKPPEEDPKAPRSVSTPVEPGQTPQEADRLRGAERGRR